MHIDDQGIERGRYVVAPRTLTFLTDGEDVLLLRGAANRARFPGRLNGVGGHMEPGEGPLAAALREVREEAGLAPEELALRAVLHISGRELTTGVLVFVFVGAAPSRRVIASAEGAPEWHPWRNLPEDVVEDLPELLARVLVPWPSGMHYGLYLAQEDGALVRSWRMG